MPAGRINLDEAAASHRLAFVAAVAITNRNW